MAYGRIVVPLSSDERGALVKIAQIECRDPREQLRYLLREEAQRRGLMETNTPTRPEVRDQPDVRA